MSLLIWPEFMRPDEREQERTSKLGDAGLMMQLTYPPTVRLRKMCEFLLHKARLPLYHLMLHQVGRGMPALRGFKVSTGIEN